MPRITALLFLLCCWSCHIGASFATVRMAPGAASIGLATQVSIFEDPSGRLTLADTQRRGNEFRPAQVEGGEAINFFRLVVALRA